MRLTLRTMLAYLDGILEPADRDEIGRKIEESEFARQLVQRLRDSARNPRLSAPRVTGKSSGPDPNTVAEYLDNTLAGERVPEFEKLCLDSDIDLAEVAACHQILTMVLGQPAEIDLEMKQHMYGIAEQASQAAPALGAGAAAGHAAALPDEMWVAPRRRKPEIPEYLRDRKPSGSKWKTWLAAAIILLVVAGATTLALGPLDRTHPVARLLGFGPAPENPPVAAGAAENPVADVENHNQATADHRAAPEATSADSGHTAPPNATAADTPQANDVAAKNSAVHENNVATPATGARESNPVAAAQNSNTADAAATANTPSDNALPSTATVRVLPSATPDAALPATAPNAMTNAPEAALPASATPPPLPTPVVSDHAAPVSQPSSSMTAAAVIPMPAGLSQGDGGSSGPAAVPGQIAGSGPAATGPAPIPPQAATPVETVALGRLVPSKSTVLLKLDAGTSQWGRTPSGEAVTSNEQLLVLPTYRPTIALSVGLTLQVPAETLLELEPPDARGIPTVKLIYGRLVVLTAGKGGTQLGLDLGGMRGVVSFVDADATLGVEVSRHVPAGTNPEVEPPQVVANLYGARGHLEWTPVGGTTTALGATQMLTLNPAGLVAASPLANMPKWIEPEQLPPLDARASEFLSQSLQDEKQLPIVLREMVDHRQVEIKSLGAQCLAMLDEFEPLIAAFSDPESRPMWSVEIASVKEALARGAGSAAKVHEACVKQHDERLGTDLYRMFLGYTKEQLQAGEAAKLVDFLDSDGLDFRVLAFTNLQEITNKTFSYQPQVPAASRATPFRRWQDELKNNTIVPKEGAGAKIAPSVRCNSLVGIEIVRCLN